MHTRSLAILVVLVLVLSSCTNDQATVQFSGMCFPATPTASGCSYSSTCSAIWMVGRIWADVGYVTEVTWPIQINNQLEDNSSSDTGHTNTHDAVVEGVRLTYGTSGLSVPSATYDQTAIVGAGGSTVIEAMLMPPNIVTFLATNLTASQEVVVQIRAVGHYTDGHRFEVGPIQIPVDVCNGCYGGSPACSTAGQVRYFCPPQAGQSAVSACVTP